MTTISESIAYVTQRAARSHGLWRPVNNKILAILRSKRSRAWMVMALRKLGGTENGPVALSNFRAAADSLERGDRVSIL